MISDSVKSEKNKITQKDNMDRGQVEFTLSSDVLGSSRMEDLGLHVSVGHSSQLFCCLLDKLRQNLCNFTCYRHGDILVEPGDYDTVSTPDKILHMIVNCEKYESAFVVAPDLVSYSNGEHLVTIIKTQAEAEFRPSAYAELIPLIKESIFARKLKQYTVLFLISDAESNETPVERLDVYDESKPSLI